MELKQTTIFLQKFSVSSSSQENCKVAMCCVGLRQLYGCGLAVNLITISLILNTRCELTSNVVLLQPKSRALRDENQEH
jgi:hypothetical protein